MNSNKYILLTIDVEDWFQVENFRQWNPHSTWNSRELRVEKNVHRLLNLFDSIELKAQSQKAANQISEMEHAKSNLFASQPSCSPASRTPCEALFYNNSPFATNNLPARTSSKQHATDHIQTKKVNATFFVLGWLAERLPHLVREIQTRGHEVASHGYNHELLNSLSGKNLENDLIGSKKLLEDIIGEAVTGYRAPSFAINDDILQTIADCGYQYDSSYNSFSLHGRYGKISLNGSARKGIARRINDNFHELPISNLQIGGINLPLGGGGYFRLIPHLPFKYGVKSILKKENAYLFFIHPWELDSEQPKVKDAFTTYKFRHYVNLRDTRDKLFNLIDVFSSCRFTTCSQYLSKMLSLSTMN